MNPHMQLIIVSGRSGSGKTIALRALEDLGFYCVDNLPLDLLPALIDTLSGNYQRVAVSLDVRNLPDAKTPLEQLLETLRARTELKSLYLDADDDTLIRRFSETRRLHPLSHRNLSLAEAIAEEARVLAPLAEHASLTLNTHDLSVHDLSAQIREWLLGKPNRELVMVFQSFGFKRGMPRDCDFVFDVRFLPNPHWEPELRPLTGQDQAVQDYLSNQPLVMKVVWQLENLLGTWLPHLERNNRSYLTVGIGCTGGQHRSVFVTELLANHFKRQGHQVQIRHLALDNWIPYGN